MCSELSLPNPNFSAKYFLSSSISESELESDWLAAESVLMGAFSLSPIKTVLIIIIIIIKE